MLFDVPDVVYRYFLKCCNFLDSIFGLHLWRDFNEDRCCYEVEFDWTTCGQLTTDYFAAVQQEKENPLLKVNDTYFEPLLNQRQAARAAKAKFENMQRLMKKYPQWSRVNLEELKAQFLSFDLNHDGLIDFPELEKALDILGDTSPYEVRRKLFDDIDVDGSDSVDFEEFIGLVDAVIRSTTGEAMAEIFRKGNEQSHVGRSLSIAQQKQLGFF